jgi:hypothetical protein
VFRGCESKAGIRLLDKWTASVSQGVGSATEERPGSSFTHLLSIWPKHLYSYWGGLVLPVFCAATRIKTHWTAVAVVLR